MVLSHATTFREITSGLCLIHTQPVSRQSFHDEVVSGLSGSVKMLSPKYFYDTRGSELFEQITELPEYYLTRTEFSIMQRHAAEILRAIAPKPDVPLWIAELGSGSGKKTTTLLREIVQQRVQAVYCPIDISEEFLLESASVLHRTFLTVPFKAVCAEFLGGVAWLNDARNCEQEHTRLVVYFPGSTIGNFTRSEAQEFLYGLRQILKQGDTLLLGADMQASPTKPASVIYQAYNDAQGVTAEFNVNILHHINHVLQGTIPTQEYRHIALYNEEEARIEMYVESISSHVFSIGVGLDQYSCAIETGERVHTEYSHKFSDERLAVLAAESGYTVRSAWHDDNQYFGVYLWDVA